MAAQSVGTVYAYPNNLGYFKAVIAGKFGNVTVDFKATQLGTDNKTPEFLKKNPFGQVPTMDTVDGPLFESNAITRYVARKGADKGLLGTNDYEASLIDQWVEVLRSNETAINGWIGPIFGFRPYDEKTWNAGKEQANKLLQGLNVHLEGREYLVGPRVTLAEVCCVPAMFYLFTMALDPEFRKPYPNVVRWFEHCCNLPQFKEVMGEAKLCSTVATPKQK